MDRIGVSESISWIFFLTVVGHMCFFFKRTIDRGLDLPTMFAGAMCCTFADAPHQILETTPANPFGFLLVNLRFPTFMSMWVLCPFYQQL